MIFFNVNEKYPSYVNYLIKLMEGTSKCESDRYQTMILCLGNEVERLKAMLKKQDEYIYDLLDQFEVGHED